MAGGEKTAGGDRFGSFTENMRFLRVCSVAGIDRYTEMIIEVIGGTGLGMFPTLAGIEHTGHRGRLHGRTSRIFSHGA